LITWRESGIKIARFLSLFILAALPKPEARLFIPAILCIIIFKKNLEMLEAGVQFIRKTLNRGRSL
jgi:hypothetical protein